jgi:hypothetical protein
MTQTWSLGSRVSALIEEVPKASREAAARDEADFIRKRVSGGGATYYGLRRDLKIR